MAEKGHRHTAEECRTKAKDLHLAYKHVLAHNSKSGNDRITFPFNKELRAILRDDSTVKGRRMSQSLRWDSHAELDVQRKQSRQEEIDSDETQLDFEGEPVLAGTETITASPGSDPSSTNECDLDDFIAKPWLCNAELHQD
ncbi:UNVERIFIED_CONTAM: hypothetical protein K2H54_026295 [Gekko kuhli]